MFEAEDLSADKGGEAVIPHSTKSLPDGRGETRAPQSGQTAHTFPGPFVQPVMGPLTSQDRPGWLFN